MKLLLPSLALAFAFFAPIAPAFAGDEDTIKTNEMSTYNTTCPVCDKAVDAKAKTATMVARPDSKNKDMVGHKVGFCGNTCHDTYSKDPAKYDTKLETQWQKAKSTPVKGM